MPFGHTDTITFPYLTKLVFKDGATDIKNKLQQINFNEKKVSETNEQIRINEKNKENGYTVEKVSKF